MWTGCVEVLDHFVCSVFQNLGMEVWASCYYHLEMCMNMFFETFTTPRKINQSY